jgi:hypothetical protein
MCLAANEVFRGDDVLTDRIPHGGRCRSSGSAVGRTSRRNNI